MAETASAEAVQNVAKGTLDATLEYAVLPNSGKIAIHISTDNIHVAKELCKLAGYVVVGTGVTTLGVLLGYRMLKPFVESAVKHAFGEVDKITPGSLHVVIHCLTDERFLKIVEDYESGRIKQYLQDELLQFGIEVEGLKVEIENTEEVNKTKEEINKKRKVAMMTEGEEKTTKESDLPAAGGCDDEWKLPTSEQAFRRDISKKHRNWLTVGELIRSIQKPIATYVDAIVKDFHKKLCDDLHSVGKCKSQGQCENKKKPDDLCVSCRSWLKKLLASHRLGGNPWWSKNCDSARWSEDPWEVAKFYMFRSNGNTKDAESTDLTSLINVLDWMRDEAFLGSTRVDIELVRKLRSQVRNKWAHAPKQEFEDSDKSQSFSIAEEFLEDLEAKFSHKETKKCQKYLEKLKTDGVNNNLESELQSLLLHRRVLDDIKEDIEIMKLERSSDRSEIEEIKRKVDELKRRYREWSERSSDLKRCNQITTNYNQFNLISLKKLNSFGAISEVFNQLDKPFMIKNEREKQQPMSNFPKPVPKFTGRESEIKDVISLLIDERKDVVSLQGGPGFGKSAIAIEVSHKLSNDHDITVFFSQLKTATTVDEMVRQLCRDEGVDYERDDPQSSLVLWLKSVQGKVIIVMDDVDNLLEDKNRDDFDNFIKFLRKNQNCQIVTTSRSSYSISTLSVGMVDVKEMDDKACIKLLREQCCVQDEVSLQKLAELCGHIPLAMCVAAPQVGNPEEFEEFCHDLKDEPFEILDDCKSNRNVYRDINMSYEKLGDQQKKILVRLAAFDESFTVDDARNVIKKGKFVTKRNLESLVCQSWIKQPTEHQYSINLLIKHFLKKQNDD